MDPVALPSRGSADGEARLLAADEALYALQAAAGARLGETIAIPQLAAVVRESLRRGRALRRMIVAASEHEDLELRVCVTPQGDGVDIAIEDWRALPRGEARFDRSAHEDSDFFVDAQLRVTHLQGSIADRFNVDLSTLPRPFTDFAHLQPLKDGSLPFLDALSRGEPFERQRASVRAQDFRFAFAGNPAFDTEGRLTGFAMTVLDADSPGDPVEERLDDTLRSPLTRIIAAADQIVDRSDGPLRSDYANYAGDIATAGRHLLSVIRSMGAGVKVETDGIDLVDLAKEATAMASADARNAGVEIEIEDQDAPIAVTGETRAVLQILVNIIGNAVRHSPSGGTVAVVFDEGEAHASVTIADQGKGIARKDQARIFEEYERLGEECEGSTGLGLAISRRLARSMRGDILLDSDRGEGARFTLRLPRA